jgi:HYR domain-containing protein
VEEINVITALAIFLVALAAVFIVGLIVIPVIEAAEATTGAGGGGEGTPTTTPASAVAAPSSSTYSKLDSTDPSLNVPNDMVLQTIFGGPTALLVYSVTVQDNVDGNATLDEDNTLTQDNVGGSITLRCGPYPSQSFLPVGNHNIVCITQDSSSNWNSDWFIVTVRDPTSPAPTDTIAPNLAVPNDMVITTDKPTEPSVEFELAATDNVDGTATVARSGYVTQDNVGGRIEMVCSPHSTSEFPVGNNTVMCRAVDAAGNRGTASFTVSVVSTAPEDTIPPVIQEPNYLPSRSPAGATTYTVVATDNVDGTATLGEYDTTATQDNVGGRIVLGCSPSSGSVFSAGDNLRCGAYDSSGNVVITTFTVPTAGVPQAAVLNATTFNATTTPLVNATTTTLAGEEEEEAPPTNATAPTNGIGGEGGTTTSADPMCTEGTLNPATDQCERVKKLPPCQLPFTFNPATGQCEAPGQQPTSPTCPAGPGITFDPIESVCVVTQSLGPPQCTPGTIYNPATDQCERNTPPSLTVPNNIVVETNNPTGTSVTYNTVRAVDNVDGEAVLESDTIRQDNVGGSITIACDPPSGSTFPAGVTTTVQCNAYDALGNVGTASFTVTVTSTTPQTLQAENGTIATAPVEEAAGEEEEQQPPAAEEALPTTEEEDTTTDEGGEGDTGGDGGDDTEDGGDEPPATTTDEEEGADDEGAASP